MQEDLKPEISLLSASAKHPQNIGNPKIRNCPTPLVCETYKEGSEVKEWTSHLLASAIHDKGKRRGRNKEDSTPSLCATWYPNHRSE